MIIKYLLEDEGITPALKKSFIEFLISHNRRILEILNPNYKDITNMYNTDFEGMTTDPISIGELERAQYAYIRAIHNPGINSDGKGHYFSTVLAKVA